MSVNKVVASFDEAVKDVFDGAVILFGGFGANVPSLLIQALARQGAKNLTMVSNNTGLGREIMKRMGRTLPDWWDDVSILCENKQIKKAITSFPVRASPELIVPFEKLFQAHEVEVENVPQGTLAERIRANKAGIGAFFTPTGAGTIIEQGKEVRVIDGRPYVLEYPIKSDFALVRAYKADRLGNLIYRGTSRTFNATMAGAANVTIAEVDEVVPVGKLDPEEIVTPAVYVDRVVVRPQEARTKIIQKIRREEH
ncbi:MAG: 3-oxoacid CoA-transferase subunit A [Chloroflexota bacterium]